MIMTMEMDSEIPMLHPISTMRAAILTMTTATHKIEIKARIKLLKTKRRQTNEMTKAITTPC